MTGNESHLAQLEGDAFAVATAACGRYPTMKIVSSKRDVRSQADAMARRCEHERDWILGDPNRVPPKKATYKWSKAAQLCHAWSLGHPAATLVEMALAFRKILEALPADELAKVSKHLAPTGGKARAFDVLPDHGKEGLACKAFLGAEALRLGGTFLEREGDQEVWHWQAK